MNTTVKDPEIGPDNSFVTHPKKYCGGKMTKRQLWCSGCGVVTVLVVVAAVLIGVFVGGKGVAQSAVDSSLITFESMSIEGQSTSQCPETAEFCFDTSLKFTLVNTYPMDATLASFSASMEYDGKVFASVPMPELALTASGQDTFNENLVMAVSDKDAYNSFAKALMTRKDVAVHMKGSLSAKGMGIWFSGLSMNKPVSLSGFNSFSEPKPTLKSIHFFEPSDEQMKTYVDGVDGVSGAMFAVAENVLPNPSVISVGSVGKITGDLMFEGVKVGTGVAKEDVKIGLGADNVLELLTVLQLDDKKGNKEAMRRLMSKYVNGEESTLTLVGTGSSNSLWDEPVKALTADVTLGGLSNLQDKLFQSVNSVVKMDKNSITNYDTGYCKAHVRDYSGFQAFGRLFTNQVLLSNPLEVELEVSDYSFMISLYWKKAIVPFAFVGSEYSKGPSQATINLAGSSKKMQNLVACAYDPIMADADDLSTAPIGLGLKLLHATAFKQLKDLYGDDALYNATEPGSTAMGLLSVVSIGENIAYLPVVLEGTQTISQPKGKFLLDQVSVKQDAYSMVRFNAALSKTETKAE